MFPLTKTLNPADMFGALAPEAAEVARVDLSQQHPMRAWEYAMALRAIADHRALANPWTESHGYSVLDVGGAGSPFQELVPCLVVDPRVNVGIEEWEGVPVSAIVAISVIEHVRDEEGFLRAIANRLIPGGLCFLTMDYWDKRDAPDTAHFHWMRERIYNPTTWWELSDKCCRLYGFELFGVADWTFNFNHVYDYTFCSLSLRKAP